MNTVVNMFKIVEGQAPNPVTGPFAIFSFGFSREQTFVVDHCFMPFTSRIGKMHIKTCMKIGFWTLLVIYIYIHIAIHTLELLSFFT